MRNRRTETARAREHGFTLFEVVIALAIAGLGLALLIQAAGTGLTNAGLADRFIAATRIAQSHLAEVGRATPLAPGAQSGEDEGGFSWETRISAPFVHPGAGSAIALYTIDVTVSFRAGDQVKSVSLRSQRTGHS